jgi:hypothetical protein
MALEKKGFDLARDAVVELQVLVCECARSEAAQIVGSLRCVSEGAEHSGVNFPGFAVLTKALLNGTGLSALGTVELLAESHLFDSSTWICPACTGESFCLSLPGVLDLHPWRSCW